MFQDAQSKPRQKALQYSAPLEDEQGSIFAIADTCGRSVRKRKVPGHQER